MLQFHTTDFQCGVRVTQYDIIGIQQNITIKEFSSTEVFSTV